MYKSHHYIYYYKKGDKWISYNDLGFVDYKNDEYVEKEMNQSYIYLYEKDSFFPNYTLIADIENYDDYVDSLSQHKPIIILNHYDITNQANQNQGYSNKEFYKETTKFYFFLTNGINTNWDTGADGTNKAILELNERIIKLEK